MANNQAAYLTGPKERPFKVGPAEVYTPGPKEILVRIHAIAINPGDAGIQALGVLVEKYPFILGADGAGIVEAVGSEVSRFKKGDRILALFDYITYRNDPRHSAFQHYALAQEGTTTLLPDALAFEDAAVLPVGIATAAAGLFQQDGLKLSLPTEKPQQKDEVVLVWGGASSVGASAVQLVHAAGYKVAAVASAKNHELLKGLGADFVFDYNDADVENKIVAALKDTPLAGAFEAVAQETSVQSCGRIAAGLGGNRFVSTTSPGFRPLPDLPEGVKAYNIMFNTLSTNEIGPHIYNEWMPKALASGQLKCKPGKDIVGHGLEDIQGAVDRVAQGVSAKKLVIQLVK